MDKKRILMIMPDRFEHSAGGMGSHSATIVKKLSSKYDFYLAAYPLTAGTKPPEFVKEYRQVGAPFTEVKSGALNVMIAQTQYLAAAVSFPKPDLVYAYDWSIYLSAMRAAEHFRVPLVVRMCLSAILLSVEGHTFGLNLKDPVQKALHNAFCEMEIRGMKNADLIVQVSEGYTKMYDKIANFRAKTRVVLNGIDLNLWQRDLPTFKLPGKNKFKAVYLGRFVEMKGILSLCNAKIPKDIDLIFIGDPEKVDATCRAAINKKNEQETNVFCLGAVYGDDKIAALQAADILLAPSFHETFGNAAMEGLAAGCIVMSSRVGGMADYLHDGNSIYCGVTSQSIEKAFEQFLKMTDTERQLMREAGIAKAKQLSLDTSAQALSAVFEEAIAMKKSYPPYPHS